MHETEPCSNPRTAVGIANRLPMVITRRYDIARTGETNGCKPPAVKSRGGYADKEGAGTMSTATSTFGTAVWSLPPLILHPFNERVPPSSLLENSKAALMLSGLIPNDGTEEDTLQNRLLNGRYSELRMLYYLGKDVCRWIGQCQEFAQRQPELADADLAPQSFAGLLTAEPPENVRQKLVGWGVADYVSIFARAIGLNSVFAEPPPLSLLNPAFLRNYHRCADYLFRCYMEMQPHRGLHNANFQFELYASGEYSKILETEWGREE
jgi:hypothetical protein